MTPQLPTNWTFEEICAEIEARRGRKIDTLYPDAGPLRRELYGKHLEFFRAGAADQGREVTEKAMIGGNQTGKTTAGSYEVTVHLTGIYPPWWEGRTWDRATAGWACGVNNITTRQVVQGELAGMLVREPGARTETPIGLGTGMIPRELIHSVSYRVGLPGAIDTLWVKHASGGISTLEFRSYEQGWQTFQGARKDFIWLDEEPELAIYTECMLRVLKSCGLLMLTATPLLGMSDVVRMFYE